MIAGKLYVSGQLDWPQEVPVESLIAFSRHFSNFQALQNEHVIEGWLANQAAPCSGNDSLWTGVLCWEGVAYGINFTDVPLNGAPEPVVHHKTKMLEVLSVIAKQCFCTAGLQHIHSGAHGWRLSNSNICSALSCWSYSEANRYGEVEW